MTPSGPHGTGTDVPTPLKNLGYRGLGGNAANM